MLLTSDKIPPPQPTSKKVSLGKMELSLWFVLGIPASSSPLISCKLNDR